LSPYPASENNGTGTVSVTIATSSAPEVVWVALTDAVVAGQWFGNLTPGLDAGGAARLDFDDGDFFTIEDIRADRPHLLQYTWRFLGIGAVDSITWRILPKGSGCLVSVTDSEPERSREWAQELRSGWLDFTRRLDRFLRTGEPSRYDWSREIQASIELGQPPSDAGRSLFASDARQAEWLPSSSASPGAEGGVVIEDGLQPARFYSTGVVQDGPSRLRFELGCDEWLNATRCYLELSPRKSGSMLSVRHAGWEAISWESSNQFEQRKRFCGIWINALKRARQLVDENSSSRQ
jgi:uncharacterized protein YndB with AHSA1/START domain